MLYLLVNDDAHVVTVLELVDAVLQAPQDKVEACETLFQAILRKDAVECVWDRGIPWGFNPEDPRWLETHDIEVEEKEEAEARAKYHTAQAAFRAAVERNTMALAAELKFPFGSENFTTDALFIRYLILKHNFREVPFQVFPL